ncbi:MAG: NAD(P)/FAD-dependent oxidoreductase, partial [Bacteroidota bacterium]
MRTITIIGGGAAGFFAAINIAEQCPNDQVIILEKTNKLLQKVRVSGGGRCNVTNHRSKPSELVDFYPRGTKKLYKSFERFTTADMVKWLNKRGVKTHTETDLRMFPVSNNSQTIIDCFLDECHKLGVKIEQNANVAAIQSTAD